MTYRNGPVWDDTRDRWVIGDCDYCDAPVYREEPHWLVQEPGQRKIQMMCSGCRDILYRELRDKSNCEDGIWDIRTDSISGEFDDKDRDWLFDQLDDDEAIETSD